MDRDWETALRYPSISVKEGKRSDIVHKHPLSSIERRVCESRLISMARGDGCQTIVDIGGNPVRHALAKEEIHSCNPYLSGVDNNRNRRFIERSTMVDHRYRKMFYNKTTWCTHKVQDCDCVEPDCYISVHSLYYLKPEHVLDLVFASKSNKLYAACHLFEKMIGSYFTYNGQSEARYQFNEDGSIHMNVNGNYSTYRHGNMEWLKQTYFEYGGRAMTWTTEMIGETAIMVFAPCYHRFDQPEGLNLSSALCDQSYFGEIEITNVGSLSKHFGYALDTVKVDKLTSVGRFVFAWTTKTSCVLVPKDAVDEVAKFMLGRPRDKDTWQSCLAKTRAVLHATKHEMPENIRVKSILYVSYIAFIKYLDEEMAITNSLVRKNKEKFAWYKRILEFNPFSACFCSDVEMECPVERYNNNNGASTEGSIYVNPNKDFKYVKVERPLAEIKDGSKIVVVKEELDPKPGAFNQTGLGFRDHVPVVPRVSQEHELIAVNNRGCMQSPPAEPKKWEKLTSVISSLPPKFVEPVAFEEWNANFPRGRRKQHEVAKRQLEEDGLLGKDLIRSSFIKLETYNKSTMDGVDDFDPRLIQGVGHKANVALGPWMAACNKELKEMFSRNGPACYASGMTSEEVGKWMENALQEFAEPLFLWCDFSRFDATQGMGCYNFEKALYLRLGIHNYPEAYQVFKAQRKTLGYTRCGIRYEVLGTRKSGDPNTSCGNTALNLSTATQTMLDMGLESFRMIALGDDLLIVTSNPTVRKVMGNYDNLKKTYEMHMTAYGFKPKVAYSLRLCDAEFCSALFWPSTDGIVLGPKPGRLMPKMGFSLKILQEDQIRGTMIGYQYNANHVPLLNDFIDFHLDKIGRDGPRVISPYKIACSRKHKMSAEGIQFFEDRYQVSYYSLCEQFHETLSEVRNLQTLLPSKLIEWCFEVDN